MLSFTQQEPTCEQQALKVEEVTDHKIEIIGKDIEPGAKETIQLPLQPWSMFTAPRCRLTLRCSERKIHSGLTA